MHGSMATSLGAICFDILPRWVLTTLIELGPPAKPSLSRNLEKEKRGWIQTKLPRVTVDVGQKQVGQHSPHVGFDRITALLQLPVIPSTHTRARIF